MDIEFIEAADSYDFEDRVEEIAGSAVVVGTLPSDYADYLDTLEDGGYATVFIHVIDGEPDTFWTTAPPDVSGGTFTQYNVVNAAYI